MIKLLKKTNDKIVIIKNTNYTYMTLFLDPEVWNTYNEARNAVSIAVFRGVNDVLQEGLSVEGQPHPPPAPFPQVNQFEHVPCRYMRTSLDKQNDRHN